MYLLLIFGFCCGANPSLPKVVFSGEKIIQGTECIEFIVERLEFIDKNGIKKVCESIIVLITGNCCISGVINFTLSFAKGVSCELNGIKLNEGVMYVDDKLLKSKVRHCRVASSYEVTLCGSVQIKENLICLFSRCIIPDGKTLMVNDILKFFPKGKKVIHNISAVDNMMYEFFLFKNDKFFIEPETIISLYTAFKNFSETKNIASDLMLECCIEVFINKQNEGLNPHVPEMRELSKVYPHTYMSVLCRKNEDFPHRDKIMAMFKKIMCIINSKKIRAIKSNIAKDQVKCKNAKK